MLCEGSPSRIGVDPEEPHGALAWVARDSLMDDIEPRGYAEMVGELAAAWVLLTAVVSSSEG